MTTPAELAATVREGAHFYMAHRMREFPHTAAPEITVAEHIPEGCPGCEAIAALDALQAQAEQSRRWYREEVAESNDTSRRLEAAEAEQDRWKENALIARAAADMLEAERDQLVARIEELEAERAALEER